MKTAKFLLGFLLMLPFLSFSQSLTGLWNGTFSNDSTTLRIDQPFEIALTEYKGKVYGYSRREFIKNDTLYFVLKRVKGKIEADSCNVTEDEFISHNLPTIDKGVKITYTFRLNKRDTIWSLDGRWKTNRVVKRKYEYYALTGQVDMSVEKDLTKSKLFPHLEELTLADDVPFYATIKKQKKAEEERQNLLAAAKKQPEPIKQPEKKPEVKDQSIAKKEIEKPKEEKPAKTEAITTPPANDVAKSNKENDKKQEEVKPKSEPVVTATNQPENVAKSTTEKPKEEKPVKSEVTTTPANNDNNVVKSDKEPEKQKEETVIKSETETAIAKPKVETPVIAKPVAAVNVEKRKSETLQFVEFKSDSLVLSLYDNGEIDGDTVSVLINGEVVLAQQGLKATAIRKTIYITPAMQDSFTLVLYAENLGRYAPNTGLIIVRDGDESSQIRFSADLQKNVAVIFKRKKK